ncbi:hypothetical protein OHA10_10775 [Kribbella sp. NBC_00662]|uniref:hypothetical protein n=1 Tax=Kribbella sp. NBC_00662 TaxID=2975969 RepID=UPI003252072E
MDYRTFDAEYAQVLAAARSMDSATLASEVERLRGMVPLVEPRSDQSQAELLVNQLSEVLDMEQPPVSDAMAAAVRVHRQTRNAQGSSTERIAALRAGIDEIGRIADTVAETTERHQILALTESLGMQLEALESSPAANPDR